MQTVTKKEEYKIIVSVNASAIHYAVRDMELNGEWSYRGNGHPVINFTDPVNVSDILMESANRKSKWHADFVSKNKSINGVAIGVNMETKEFILC